MKCAPATTSIEPTIGTATAHLTIIHDALSPGTMSLVTVFARPWGEFARDLGQQGLDIAPTLYVEPLILTPLGWIAPGRLSCQLLAKRTINLDKIAIGSMGDIRSGSRGLFIRCQVHREAGLCAQRRIEGRMETRDRAVAENARSIQFVGTLDCRIGTAAEILRIVADVGIGLLCKLLEMFLRSTRERGMTRSAAGTRVGRWFCNFIRVARPFDRHR